MFNNLRIGTKLFLGFSTIVLLMIVILVTMIYSFNSIEKTSSVISHEFEISKIVNAIVDNANLAKDELSRYVITRDPEMKKALSEAVSASLASADEVSQMMQSEENKKNAAIIHGLCNDFDLQFKDFEKIGTQFHDADSQREQMAATFKEKFADLDQEIIDLIKKTSSEGIGVDKINLYRDFKESYNAYSRARIAYRNAALALTKDDNKRYRTEFLNEYDSAINLFKRVRDDLPEENAKRVDELSAFFSTWKNKIEIYLDLKDQMIIAEAQLTATVENILNTSYKILDGVYQVTKEANISQANTIIWARYISITITVLSAIIACFMAMIVTRSIVSGLQKVTRLINRISSEGNLDVEVTQDLVERKDEVGDLAREAKVMISDYHAVSNMGESVIRGDWTYQLRVKSEKDTMNKNLAAMLDQVNDVLNQVSTATQQVTTGASQVAATSETLSQGATETAASLEEITSSMTEMGTQTHQNAQNAQEASQLAKTASDAAINGQKMMKEMIASMEKITSNSQDVQKVVKVIDDIAFQTNLLALNAAVEAARAGVHGKGFAVVAEEVRNLAARCAKAAGETTQMIENNNRQITDGAEIAHKTDDMLNQIVEEVTHTNNLINEIAKASHEQAQGVSQVTQALQQIDAVTQQNTASAEETASVSNEMSSHAIELQKVMARLKLRSNVARPNLSNTGRYQENTDVGSYPASVQKRSLGMAIKKATGQSPDKGWGESGSSTTVADNDYNFKLDDSEFGKF